MHLRIFICVAFVIVGTCWSETCPEHAARVNANPMPGAEVPSCEADGSYSAVQHAGSQAVCVTPEGESIPGYSVNRWEKEGMHCACARQEYAFRQTGMVGQTFNCDSKGNFEPVQCRGSMCGCHNDLGEALEGKPFVHVSKINELNCDTSVTPRRCQDHVAAVQKSPMPGRETPHCEEDGTYSPKQYSGSMAICVTKDNERIQDYGVHRWEDEGMHCECARKKHEFSQTGMVGGRSHNCDEKGNFRPIQCMGTGCSCHDSHGRPVPGSPTVRIWEQDSLTCEVVP